MVLEDNKAAHIFFATFSRSLQSLFTLLRVPIGDLSRHVVSSHLASPKCYCKKLIIIKTLGNMFRQRMVRSFLHSQVQYTEKISQSR